MQDIKITVAEVVWLDDGVSSNYIVRLNKYLSPNGLKKPETAMFNKEILPGINKTNKYNRLMLVFDYEENKEYQRCFSYSSPKDTDRKNDLRYYKLPTQTKIMLNSSIDIPSKYLIKANLEEMLKEEENMQINKNIRNNIINLNYARKFKKDILEQYDVIKNNVEDNHKFHKSGVKKAHYMMINDEKQFMFCELELLRIEYDKLEKKVKQLKYKINNHSVIKELENNEKYGIKNESFKEMMMLLKNGINIRPSTKELKKAKE